ncbi:MAG: recombinase family protein [Alphaproteobacteria bacterium]|nr:recombinase family protein [Alphaproteobacteria bacterium]
MSKRVALYLRPTPDQGIEEQRATLISASRLLGWTVVAEYRDDELTGDSLRRRSGFNRLRCDIGSGDFEMILVTSLDKLGSMPDLVKIMDETRNHGVGFFLHDEGLDDSTLAGRAHLDLLFEVLRNFHRSTLREKALVGHERARANGVRIGRPKLEMSKLVAAEAALKDGCGVRETARRVGGISPASVQRLKNAMMAEAAP